MIKIENTDVYGWEAAIRGMRNPMNSWDMSDTYTVDVPETPRLDYFGNVVEIIPAHERVVVSHKEEKWNGVGENDLKLMKSLSKAGSDHAKFLRFINVTVDITAPLYWWKEFDTYKVGTVANSCSTMHKIHENELTLDDFSHEHLTPGSLDNALKPLISILNSAREAYLNFDEYNAKDPEGWDEGIKSKKDIWWQMIQLLPSSYNQKRTVQLNYQVLKSMYFARRNHRLDEWHTLCDWMLTLPYFKEICIDVE